MSSRSSSVDRRAQSKRRPLTSTLTLHEHERFYKIAARHNLPPTTYATKIIRAEIARQELENAE